jgi:DNA helicase II / ATP-dependent DNA helicase PcrA
MADPITRSSTTPGRVDSRLLVDVSADAAAPVSLAAVNGLLAGLNREQRRAVTHGDGAQLVIAGPGTGKTEVVTRRIAWLIETKRARPREILALTFTDAAAEEMQARVDELVPYGQADAAIHTFHALGDRLIREHAFELGLPGDVRLINRAEGVLLLREQLFELGLDRYRPLGDPTRFLAALVDLFSRAKDEGITPQSFAQHAVDLQRRAASAEGADRELLEDMCAARGEVASAFSAYERQLSERGLIDHGDQIGLAVRLLRERPSIRQMITSRYRYLLVDEFQDTNPTQLEMVLALAGQHGNVTVVGDPDQAIYTFRGAAVSNLRRFVNAHPRMRVVKLRRNYRSLAPVIEAAHRLIQHNGAPPLPLPPEAADRQLAHRRARRPAPLRQLAFETPSDEADGVAARIAERVSAGERPRDFALLVRTNHDADTFLRALAARGVPAVGGLPGKLLDQPEVRALLAYLRVIASPDDSMELYLLATAKPYGVGHADLATVAHAARRSHESLWAVLQAVSDESRGRDAMPVLSTDGRQSICRLVTDVRHGLSMATRRSSGELLYEYLRQSGRLAALAAMDVDGEGGLILRSVAQFFRLVRARASLLPEDRIAFLVPHLTRLEEAGAVERDLGPLDDDAVAVLTVHRAKGLEFRVVYLSGLVDGRFPGHARPPVLTLPAELLAPRGDAPDDDPLAEERRLAYVAMTRARDELWLTYHRAGPDGRGRRRPSPFLAEALDAPIVSPTGGAGLLAGIAPGPVAQPSPIGNRAAAQALVLSYSQLDDYITCPERYRLRHVVGIPTPPHHALSYGSAMHQAVGAFHLRRAQGEAMSEEDLLGAFGRAWSPEGYLSPEHEAARFKAGCEALRRFRHQQLPVKPHTVAIEKPFSFVVGRDTIRGRMDRLDRTPEGALIVDYKASDVPQQSKADSRARESLQLQIYALAHEAETHELPHEMQLHFLDSGTIGRVAPDASRLETARRKITAAADGIRTGQFKPRPNPVACGFCPFRQICPSSAG